MKRMYLKSILIVAVIAGFTSCKKVEDTVAKISVVDIQGAGISEVSVRLFGDGSGSTVNVGDIRVDETAITNAAGDAIFDFSEFYEAGQSGLFVLQIEIEKDSLSAESIIKIEPEIVNEETVILQ